MKSKNQNKKNQNHQDKTTTIPVYGLTCQTCQSKIELNLMKLDGVKDANTNLKKKEVVVTHNSAATINNIKKTIEDTGYQTKKENAARTGILYGLIPHVGCIAFIIASIVGATFFMNLFTPLLMKSYFFYALIAVSIIFATLSATIYLKKNNLLNIQGVKRQKKYLITLYSSTILINLALFLLIFPLTANLASARSSLATEDSLSLELNVVIPCSGHAPLIINELKKEEGVQDVRYTFPYKFVVKYDGDVTNTNKIMQANIFKEFPAS